MNDPYSVLGISSTATDDEVKSAYHALARKYHPDNYANNPLADLANEKMKEINAAYDTIKSQRKAGGNARTQSNNQGYSYAGGFNGTNPNSNFADIRRLLQNGMITQAQELLDGVAVSSRDAEWYYLKGVIFYNRGWVNDAIENFRKACDMDSGNTEYRTTLNQLLTRVNQEKQRSTTVINNGGCCIPCSLCTGLMCADCTCSACRCCF